MTNYIKNKVDSLLSGDKKALQSCGVFVHDLVKSKDYSYFKRNTTGSSLPEQMRYCVERIKNDVRELEELFGAICVTLAKKDYYSIEDLASNDTSIYVVHNNNTFHYADHLMKEGSMAIRTARLAEMLLHSEDLPVSQLILCQSLVRSAESLLCSVLHSASEPPNT